MMFSAGGLRHLHAAHENATGYLSISRASGRQKEPQEQHLAGDRHQRAQELQLCSQGVRPSFIGHGCCYWSFSL